MCCAALPYSQVLHAEQPPPTAQVADAALAMQPGDYVWTPQLSPTGPTLVVVSLPDQVAYVYRNGIRIGMSTVSTGKPGYLTPVGIFTVLQKHREHYSNRYDNAPMPFMQRLTWDGVALHGGSIPGYPASHGCVRLPYAFSEKLFDITRPGTTVVIVDAPTGQASFVAPALAETLDAAGSQIPSAASHPQDGDFAWFPEASTEGPVSVVLSTRDRQVVVLRNGVEVGHAPVQLNAPAPGGTRVYMVLAGAASPPSAVVPDRPALRWVSVPATAGAGIDSDPRAFAQASGLRVSPQFARRVYDLMAPGTTLVVTDEEIRPAVKLPSTVLQADTPSAAPAIPPATTPADRPNLPLPGTRP